MTDNEKLVAGVVGAVLQAQDVRADDDILSLGGDSLQAIHVALALEKRMGVHIPVEVVGARTSVAEIAAWLDAAAVAPTLAPAA